MAEYFYDLHIHSCLSPCGDEQMTPPNIANMAYIKGLDIIAITDHNSCRNVGAVCAAAAELPLVVIPGMELCTAEEIHVVCLFPTVTAAEAAGAVAEAALPPIDNRPEIFGEQEIRSSEEELVGRVDRLLINATSISIDDTVSFVEQYGGFCFPAHIDKASNSIMAAFGYLPEHLGFKTVEVARPEVFLATPTGRSVSASCRILTNSDAHLLESISEAARTLELPSLDFYGLRAAILG